MSRTPLALKIGAVIAILTGLAHFGGAHLAPRAKAEPGDAATLERLMESVKDERMKPTPRSMHDLVTGYSLCFVTQMLFLGVAPLVFARTMRERAGGIRTLAGVMFAHALVLTVIAWLQFFLVPFACCAAAALAFLIAYVQAARAAE